MSTEITTVIDNDTILDAKTHLLNDWLSPPNDLGNEAVNYNNYVAHLTKNNRSLFVVTQTTFSAALERAKREQDPKFVLLQQLTNQYTRLLTLLNKEIGLSDDISDKANILIKKLSELNIEVDY